MGAKMRINSNREMVGDVSLFGQKKRRPKAPFLRIVEILLIPPKLVRASGIRSKFFVWASRQRHGNIA